MTACAGPGRNGTRCDREATKTSDLCRAHNRQRNDGADLTPIRAKGRPQPSDADADASEILAASPGWERSALCRRIGKDAWDSAKHHEQIEACGNCEVRRECLAFAFVNQQTEIVHAGKHIRLHALTAERWREADDLLTGRATPKPKRIPPRQPAHDWTAQEDQMVVTLSTKDAAARIGVSVSVIQRRRAALGVRRRQGPRKPWTENADRIVITSTVSEAARILGRPESTVVTRRATLRNRGVAVPDARRSAA